MDILFQRNENLIGVYRLDEIVGNLTPDSLVHDVFFLAFRNHHYRCCRLNVLYSLQSFKTGQARHHLIEQDKIESFLTTKLNSIYAIAHRYYVVAFLLKEDDVTFQQIYLIIYPQ